MCRSGIDPVPVISQIICLLSGTSYLIANDRSWAQSGHEKGHAANVRNWVEI